MATLVEHNGKLALKMGTFPLRDGPVKQTDYYVSEIPIEQVYPKEIIGREVSIRGGNVFEVCYADSVGSIRHAFVDTAGWQPARVEEPIKSPRNGQEYTWEWECFDWRKVDFPKCSECYEYHNPSLPYCETCGYCHKPGKHLVRRYQKLVSISQNEWDKGYAIAGR